MIPGTPNRPVTAAVIAFMGKIIPKLPNTAFIISKKIPPRRLFSNIFPIAFNGISNIFPKKHTASRPHAYARKMPASIPNSISFTPQKNQEMTGYHLLIIFHISIFYYKPTVLFFLQQLSGE